MGSRLLRSLVREFCLSRCQLAQGPPGKSKCLDMALVIRHHSFAQLRHNGRLGDSAGQGLTDELRIWARPESDSPCSSGQRHWQRAVRKNVSHVTVQPWEGHTCHWRRLINPTWDGIPCVALHNVKNSKSVGSGQRNSTHTQRVFDPPHYSRLKCGPRRRH